MNLPKAGGLKIVRSWHRDVCIWYTYVCAGTDMAGHHQTELTVAIAGYHLWKGTKCFGGGLPSISVLQPGVPGSTQQDGKGNSAIGQASLQSMLWPDTRFT